MQIRMIDVEELCVGIAELVPLFAALFSLIYGLKHFLRRENAVFTNHYQGHGQPCLGQSLSFVPIPYK